jgi:hypothetical protein
MDELKLLLQEAENALKKSPPSTQGYTPVRYTQSPAIVYCECGREYHGMMTHVEGMDNIYNGYKMPYCPQCIHLHEALWWRNTFRMELREIVRNSNGLEEVE